MHKKVKRKKRNLIAAYDVWIYFSPKVKPKKWKKGTIHYWSTGTSNLSQIELSKKKIKAMAGV